MNKGQKVAVVGVVGALGFLIYKKFSSSNQTQTPPAGFQSYNSYPTYSSTNYNLSDLFGHSTGGNAPSNLPTANAPLMTTNTSDASTTGGNFISGQSTLYGGQPASVVTFASPSGNVKKETTIQSTGQTFGQSTPIFTNASLGIKGGGYTSFASGYPQSVAFP